ncbi:hypothetical protein B0H17DRAFT_1147701 [Mycena rosella]|uniref:Uncharacterized protein n=1 Tax=Mycena rosella TaxID=1033263 RepID=A0AAD7FXW8_MYCRO|nr:hypothetical protein B0H17DRAFT_1147701 [Mycena rosella]
MIYCPDTPDSKDLLKCVARKGKHKASDCEESKDNGGNDNDNEDNDNNAPEVSKKRKAPEQTGCSGKCPRTMGSNTAQNAVAPAVSSSTLNAMSSSNDAGSPSAPSDASGLMCCYINGEDVSESFIGTVTSGYLKTNLTRADFVAAAGRCSCPLHVAIEGHAYGTIQCTASSFCGFGHPYKTDFGAPAGPCSCPLLVAIEGHTYSTIPCTVGLQGLPRGSSITYGPAHFGDFGTPMGLISQLLLGPAPAPFLLSIPIQALALLNINGPAPLFAFLCRLRVPLCLETVPNSLYNNAQLLQQPNNPWMHPHYMGASTRPYVQLDQNFLIGTLAVVVRIWKRISGLGVVIHTKYQNKRGASIPNALGCLVLYGNDYARVSASYLWFGNYLLTASITYALSWSSFMPALALCSSPSPIRNNFLIGISSASESSMSTGCTSAAPAGMEANQAVRRWVPPPKRRKGKKAEGPGHALSLVASKPGKLTGSLVLLAALVGIKLKPGKVLCQEL